ncbi:MAG: type II toxin-antitoxin system mRNA interferase toxin, RelE/StbE family [Patescibacteria group bacterium]
MKITYSKIFLKHFYKAPEKIQFALERSVEIFRHDQFNRSLRNHALKGKWEGFRSIDVTANWRALYRELEGGEIEWVEFVEIGTHSQLYK